MQFSHQPTLRTARRRRGAALLEGAFVLLILLTLLLGVFEFGAIALRRNLLADAARRIAREATFHGQRHASDPWGPAAQELTASDAGPIATLISPVLFTMQRENVTIRVDWPDGGNRAPQRVRVVLEYEEALLLSKLWQREGVLLRAECTMPIEY